MLGTPFSFSFYSTLHAQSAIAPHSGPSNLRLRCHLPLIVPKAGGKAGGKANGSQASSASTPGGASSPPSSSPPINEYDSLEAIQAAVPCGIRIGDQIRAWEEGKCLVFDDAYEHEVWNRTEEERVLLLVDFWHVSSYMMSSYMLVAIFLHVFYVFIAIALFFLHVSVRSACFHPCPLSCGSAARREGGREGGTDADSH